MGSLPEKCRREECGEKRTSLSVFCERHHREELQKFELPKGEAEKPCETAVKRIRRTLKNREINAITERELTLALIDQFLYQFSVAAFECWDQCMDELPAGVMAGMCAECKDNHGVSDYYKRAATVEMRAAREKEMLQAQGELVRRIEMRLRQG